MSYLCPRVDYSLICTKFSVNIIAVGISCVVGIYAAYPVSGVKSSREGFPAKNRGTDSSRRRGCRAELDICIRNNIVMRSTRHIDQIRANITRCSIILKLNLIPVRKFSNDMNVRPTFSGTNDSTVPPGVRKRPPARQRPPLSDHALAARPVQHCVQRRRAKIAGSAERAYILSFSYVSPI